MTLETYKTALNWLGKGFHVLPIQPGTKKQVSGFGPYLTHITNMQQAAEWFRHTHNNLAVVAPENKFILDFDDFDLYLTWAKQVSDEAAQSYTEITPSEGVHVFLCGVDPRFQVVKRIGKKRLILAETKRVALVAPSMLDGKAGEYEVFCNGEIYAGPVEAALFPLSKLLPPTPAPKPMGTPATSGSGLIQQIKAKVTITQLLQAHYPKAKLRGAGRFRSACCPFHSEKEPSFWVDVERNLFGCHACPAHGDVVNFYALAKGISVQAAILELSAA